MAVELREEQAKAVEMLGNGKVLYGGVGAGKSITAIAYYIKNEAPKNIYVITTAKKRDSLDWEREAVKFNIGTELSMPGYGTITVDSWNNIQNYTEVKDAFFIFDEQRVVGRGAWVKAFYRIAKRNRWILLTATPGDTWIDYIPLFVANGLYRNATEFTREHVVYAPFSKYPRIVRYDNVDLLERYRTLLLVEMPYESPAKSEVIEIDCDYDKELYRKATVDRWNPYTDEPIQDVAELFRVMRRIVNSDPSRIRSVGTILDQHPRLIVFYNFDYELEILRTLGKRVPLAEWNGHRHQPIPEGDSWAYLVQYVAGAEAWECIETDAMCFYSLTYSYKNFTQAKGRIDRSNTPFSVLKYYVLCSKASIDRAVRRSLAEKKDFNQLGWARKMWGLSGVIERG